MAYLSVKTNQLAGPSGVASQSTTDPGFTPKALFVWNGLQASTGFTSNSQFNMSMSSASAAHSAGYNSLDSAAAQDSVISLRSGETIRALSAGNTISAWIANLTSLDTNGFTHDFTRVTTLAQDGLYDYFAIGGDDIKEVAPGSFAFNTTTGNQSVTGVGFRPSVVFFQLTIQTATGDANANNPYGFGVMTQNDQWALGVKSQNTSDPTNTSRSFANNRCILLPSTTADSVVHAASYVSMDTDGFTVNVNTAQGTALLCNYLAIRGGKWKTGTDTQRITTTGLKSTTGVGFTPSALMFAGVCDTTTNGSSANARMFFGAADGTRNVSVWTGDRDNSANTIAQTHQSNTKCIVHATESALLPAVNAEADLDSLDGDGFTLDWTTVDGTARVFGYVAMAPLGIRDIIMNNGMIPFERA